MSLQNQPAFVRKHGRSSTRLETVDAKWLAYHRHVFQVCARRLPPSEELVQFAIAVARPAELGRVAERILDQKEYLKLPPDSVAELESIAPHAPTQEYATENTEPRPSAFRMRYICLSVTRHHEQLHDTVVRSVAGDPDAPTERTAVPPVVDEVARLFGLSETHVRIIMTLYAREDIETLSNLMRQTRHQTQIALTAAIAEIELTSFVKETAPGCLLERLGLISLHAGRDEMSDVTISRPLLFALRSNTLDDLMAGLFDETPPSQFALSEFSVSPEETQTCGAAVRGGYPLLIAGEPGVGKTEFARSLVAALGRRAHTLAAVNRGSDGTRRSRGNNSEGSRFNAIRMAANLLSSTTDVLVIDEADSILQSAAGFFGFLDVGNYDKALLNDLLEHLPIATIWITNDHRMIPASALRRFGHVVAFPHPNVETRVRLLRQRLEPLVGSSDLDSRETDRWSRDLASRYDITPAAIDRAARIIGSELDAEVISSTNIRDRVSGYFDQISTGALAQDIRSLPTVASSFDPQFCSPSEPLDRVERQAFSRVQAKSGLRLLFGGPPGGGKTQYALWLAKRLGRDVVLRRPSDLLSKWVGDSEKQIAEAFHQAARSGFILIIDEADALLYDRSTATHSWEQTQIAEFLQQIQEFSGVLIACTNRVDAVDPALRRRFHKHITFGPVSASVLPGALEHIFPGVAFSDTDRAKLRQGPPLMMSDLATAAEMMEVDSIGEEHTVESLDVVNEVLANARARDRTRQIGF